jgi:hypothetical protein
MEMEHVFPIHCTILEGSPNVNTDHQRDGEYDPCPHLSSLCTVIDFRPSEIENQRVVVVESTSIPTVDPTSRRSSVAGSVAAHATSFGVDTPGTPGEDEIKATRRESEALPLEYTAHSTYAYLTTSAAGGGVAHGIVTGERFSFTRCEDEPIHIPGAIQSHGMLIGVQMAGKSDIRYISRVRLSFGCFFWNRRASSACPRP